MSRETLNVLRYIPPVVLIASVFWQAPMAAAAPLSIEVSQGRIVQGYISPYTGPLSAVANYNYIQPSGYPIHGPASAAFEGRIFFYEGADGLHFNVIFNTDSVGNGTVDWVITVEDSTSDPLVQLSDDDVPPQDTPDLIESATDNIFLGTWAYGARVDGGVIGALGGAAWSITIDQIEYTTERDLGIRTLRAFDGSGSSIPLSNSTSPAGRLHFRAVPEPSTLLLAAIAAATVWLVRRQFGLQSR